MTSSTATLTSPAGAVASLRGAVLRFAPGWQERAFTEGLAWLLALYHRPEVVGLDELPRGKPLLYVAKHPQSWLYGETLLFAAAVAQARLVPVSRFDPGPGGEAARESPLLLWPKAVGREKPQREALSALRRGESLLVYPGGGRERTGPADLLQWRHRRGYAHLAVRTGTPVVPMVIDGADQQHPLQLALRGGRLAFLPPVPVPVKLVFRFGEPMAPPPRGNSLTVTAFAEEVAHATRILLSRVRRRRGR